MILHRLRHSDSDRWTLIPGAEGESGMPFQGLRKLCFKTTHEKITRPINGHGEGDAMGVSRL